MTTIKLRDVLAQGRAALLVTGARLAGGDILLDCTGVDELSDEQLLQLLAELPTTWEVADLATVVDPQSLSDSLADQLTAWFDARAGGTAVQEPVSSPTSTGPLVSYRTAHLRDQLEAAVRADLLGPADGPAEFIDERNVRSRYLVGMLAPKGQSALPEMYDDGDVAGRDSQDGAADAPPPKATAALLPSSIGLTFSVAGIADALIVTARWGRYDRVQAKDEAHRNDDGSYRRLWQRSQCEGSSPIPLRAGRIDGWSPCADYPEVMVQGIVRRRDTHWIVTLFLINGQQEPETLKDSAWLFQPELCVEGVGGAAIFKRHVPLQEVPELEEQMMAMLYRQQVEFAVGHGVAVDAEVSPEQPEQATRLWTEIIPAYELPQTTSPTADDFPELADLTLDMQELAGLQQGAFAQHLAPLVAAYSAWIASQEQRLRNPSPDLARYRTAGETALANCRTALARIQEGIALLDRDAHAAEAFRFANEAMAQQRVRSLFAAGVRRGEEPDLAALDTPANHSWRAFQLGFILLNLPSLTDPRHPDRAVPLDDPHANPAAAVADLLWFPTGGGKTEAYLGLAAYTMAMRRLQGELGGRSGHAGVAVLMRYTLRLLTLQQFQRASTLICACEKIRRDAPARWGSEPFRIGLWVGGRATPNRIEDADDAVKQLRKGNQPGGGTPHQLTNCPWCGTPIDPGRDIVPETQDFGRERVFTYCGSLLDHCPFNQRQAAGEGLPVMVVDEEIYRRLPTLLIATVDKFAQMPWDGRTAMLFGQVDGYCERHGYRSPDIEDAQSHPFNRRSNLPAARTLAVGPLRPPDLIIQDELHLISGPLGTLVGLYETAVDALSSWELDGKRIRPKVIASTATIRRAEAQVHSLFLRRVQIFPPQGLDAGDNFFSRQRPPSDTYPGRRYVGICPLGIRHKTALIQSYVALLAAAQQIAEEVQSTEIDPWMTLVGYFNSLRELAAMRRAVDDTVSNRLKKMNQRGLARRFLDPWSVKELTSRLSAVDIPEILDQLEVRFPPATATGGKTPRKGPKGTKQERFPIDVLLATNMISVGVDVSRLGLMVVAGQPKGTAEYIQATSRVGRQHPGLVATVYNWARPRDLSHYERFKHYHATFYQYVEALSVTPFAPRALDRGLSALLVALVRLEALQYNANEAAGDVAAASPLVAAAMKAITERAALVTGSANGSQIGPALQQRVDAWMATITATVSATLGYKGAKDGATVPLLQPAGGDDWPLFACLNSLRDVEPSVNLILDDQGLDRESAPTWSFDGATPDDGRTATAAEGVI